MLSRDEQRRCVFQLAFTTHHRAARQVQWEAPAFSFSSSNENKEQQPEGSEKTWLSFRGKKNPKSKPTSSCSFYMLQTHVLKRGFWF